MPEQVIQCAAACTVTVQHEITLPLLDLSPVEGAQIGSAILLVWAVAWSFRVLVQTIKLSDGNQLNED